MPLWRPHAVHEGGDVDRWLEDLPNRPAVYAVHTANAAPYCGRASQLRRRLTRLLGVRGERSPFLNLRELATGVEVQWTASWLETNLVYYDLVRSVHADRYRSVMRLRMPPYIKVGLANPFPRCYVSTRLSGTAGFWYGPFPTRAAAEKFGDGLLDLFQLRRCTEDLSPAPEHPGCIYGEMNLCLRPCQMVVGKAEYASEVARVTGFLASQGRSMLEAAANERDRLSAELRFEDAAREHRRLEKIGEVLRQRGDLASDVAGLHGVAVTRSLDAGAVQLWFMIGGAWVEPVRFQVEAAQTKSVSLDTRLRDATATLRRPDLSLREREDHLAILCRWYYSTFRDGEWLGFPSLDALPYRRLVRAVSRVASGAVSSSPASP